MVSSSTRLTANLYVALPQSASGSFTAKYSVHRPHHDMRCPPHGLPIRRPARFHWFLSRPTPTPLRITRSDSALLSIQPRCMKDCPYVIPFDSVHFRCFHIHRFHIHHFRCSVCRCHILMRFRFRVFTSDPHPRVCHSDSASSTSTSTSLYPLCLLFHHNIHTRFNTAPSAYVRSSIPDSLSCPLPQFLPRAASASAGSASTSL